MKLGILKADTTVSEHVSGFGDYTDMFRNLLKMTSSSIELKTYDIISGDYPKDINEVDAYLLTGSKAGVYDQLDWFDVLADFVKELHASRKKLIGICFGHQFIAHTLEGRAEKSSKGWGLGRQVIQLNEGDNLYSKDVSEFSLMSCHQDQVTIPAKGAKVIAGNEFCPYAMCTIGDHILTFQSHPEFSKEFALQLLDKEHHVFGDELYLKAVRSLEEPLDQELISGWMNNFMTTN